MALCKVFEVSEQALRDAAALGVDVPDLEGWVRECCRKAAPITHEDGIWRHGDFVFDEEDGVIVKVAPY